MYDKSDFSQNSSYDVVTLNNTLPISGLISNNQVSSFGICNLDTQSDSEVIYISMGCLVFGVAFLHDAIMAWEHFRITDPFWAVIQSSNALFGVRVNKLLNK